jgi:hypothetical protein
MYAVVVDFKRTGIQLDSTFKAKARAEARAKAVAEILHDDTVKRFGSCVFPTERHGDYWSIDQGETGTVYLLAPERIG